MAERVLLVQGGDDGRAVMLPSEGKTPDQLTVPTKPQPRSHAGAHRDEGSRRDPSQSSPGKRTSLPRLAPEPPAPAASWQRHPVRAWASGAPTAEETRGSSEERRAAQRKETEPTVRTLKSRACRIRALHRAPRGWNESAPSDRRQIPPLSTYVRVDSAAEKQKSFHPRALGNSKLALARHSRK